jgi:hypothetical protein
VAKVKKRAGLTGVRNVKGGKAKSTLPVRSPKATVAKRSTTAGGRAGSRSRVTRKSNAKAMAKKKGSRQSAIALVPSKKGRAPTAPAAIRVAVRELDPQRKCGEGTSVRFLYRVDETVDGRATAHLVFFDRHGWYCEHGRTCPAVAHAKKHNGQFARVS